MTPMQQILLGVGAKKKVYIDEVFNTQLWVGNGSTSTRTMTTGIDLVNEDGMVWVKNRDTGNLEAKMIDTIRGQVGSAPNAPYYLMPSKDNAQGDRNWQWTFLNNGFSFGQDYGDINGNGDGMAAWTFRKTSGFFTIVQWTGDGSSNRQISHDLKSIPGCIMVKCKSHASNWRVYHRGNATSTVGAEHWALTLNENSTAADGPQYFNDTLPTSTNFTVGNSSNVNETGRTYIAYLFAGGESTAATARSIDFSGSSDEIFENSTSSVLRNWFDQAFTVEYWVKADALASGDGGGTNAVGVSTLGTGNLSWSFGPNNAGQIRFSFWNGSNESTILPSETIKVNQWYHLAFVHDGSNNCKIFINGTLGKEATISNGTANAGDMVIGQVQNTQFNGKVSNLRITHQALYTTSFRPPTEPLTTTSQGATASNVKLLCCNNSSITGSTVSPSGMNNNGSPTASTDSPFDDPAGLAFGDSGSESIIKCGSYIGNGSTDGPEVYLGWEPQWILLKNTSSNNSWRLYDSMRGINKHADDELIHPDSDGAAYVGNTDEIDLTSTGFKMVMNDSGTNTNGGNYSYVAIRRSDSYVQKPVEDATKVFAMDTGGGSSQIPNFDSGFPVDFAFHKKTAVDQDWFVAARLRQNQYMSFNNQNAETNNTGFAFDHSGGWNQGSIGSSYQSWMFKRYAGFDVVAGTAEFNRHNLGRTPEMVVIKRRNQAQTWFTWHKDLNGGGSNSLGYHLGLNGNSAQANWGNVCPIGNSALPTAVDFQTGTDDAVRHSHCIAFLFASVDKISKCGVYDGSSSSQTVTTGFAPRFVLIKRIDGGSYPWVLLDTTRGWGSGNDQWLQLNDSSEQLAYDMGAPTSTGFTVPVGSGQSTYVNENNQKYIYYAHA